MEKSGVSERNSILEILRLCASLWVMYYHGMSLIPRSSMFSNGRIAVDFFFILSGFFLLKGFKKEYKNNYLKDLFSFLWKRFKPFWVTFSICFVFSLISYIQFYDGFFNSSIWGYLWYIPHLFVVFAIYYTFYRYIKNKRVFNFITFILSSICYVLILTYVTNYGIFRGIAGVGAGILLSQIPSIKKSNIGKGVSLTLVVTLFVTTTLIAIFYPETIFQDIISLLVLFPALIYFSSQINFSNKIINNICSISLGLYMYQAVVSLLEDNGIIVIGWQMFLVVLGMAILDKCIMLAIKNKRNTVDIFDKKTR